MRGKQALIRRLALLSLLPLAMAAHMSAKATTTPQAMPQGPSAERPAEPR